MSIFNEEFICAKCHKQGKGCCFFKETEDNIQIGLFIDDIKRIENYLGKPMNYFIVKDKVNNQIKEFLSSTSLPLFDKMFDNNTRFKLKTVNVLQTSNIVESFVPNDNSQQINAVATEDRWTSASPTKKHPPNISVLQTAEGNSASYSASYISLEPPCKGGQAEWTSAFPTKCIFLSENGCELPEEIRPLYCRVYPFWPSSDFQNIYVLSSSECLAQEKSTLNWKIVNQHFQYTEKYLKGLFEEMRIR